MGLDVDKEGFLRDYRDWTTEKAPQLAKAEGIVLTEDHWQIINIVRDYYADYRISPATRVLSQLIKSKLGEEKARSIYLMQLFSGKPAKIIAKVAGLPKPNNCD